MMAGLLVVTCAMPVSAAAPWILTLPPLKDPAKPPDREAPIPSASARGTITGRLDAQAPIEQWQRAETFDTPEACEEARLRHMREFSAALDRAGENNLSPDDRAGLVTLAQQAWSRCVPAFAFSEKR
jgi:hypothetical protein